MYCVNCGKQVDGTIPICQDCALLVLHNSVDTPLSKKVALEAEDLALDSNVASSELKRDSEVESTDWLSSLLVVIIYAFFVLVTLAVVVISIYEYVETA